jgi:DUF4097 and DUF4098 domain-containing protein YvlB
MTRAPAVALSLLAACGAVWAGDDDTSKVNGSIDIAPGRHAGDVSTVNGSIHIGANAVVGRVDTVNGGISLAARAAAAELGIVNGFIRLDAGVHVSGRVHAVNGPLSAGNGADVGGGLANVNGPIRVAAAHVGGLIDTVSGDIEVGPDARVDGGIHIGKDTSWFRLWFWPPDIPRVVIGPGSVVRGTLRFEREVKLYVSDRATIGRVEGATAVRFSGEHPPT